MDRDRLVATVVWTLLAVPLVAYVGAIAVYGLRMTFFTPFVYVGILAGLTAFRVLPKPPFLDLLTPPDPTERE